jgi:hypothetical protein
LIDRLTSRRLIRLIWQRLEGVLRGCL